MAAHGQMLAGLEPSEGDRNARSHILKKTKHDHQILLM